MKYDFKHHKYVVIYTWLKVWVATKIQVQESKIVLLMVCGGIQNVKEHFA
jgi:hypothetical protein